MDNYHLSKCCVTTEFCIQLHTLFQVDMIFTNQYLEPGCIVIYKKLSCSSNCYLGPTQSGKSSYLQKILLRRNCIFNPPPRTVIVYYSQWQKSYEILKQNNAVDHFIQVSQVRPAELLFQFYAHPYFQGAPSQDSFLEMVGDGDKSSICIFDDIGYDLSDSGLDMTKVFNVWSHHRNCRCVMFL